MENGWLTNFHFGSERGESCATNTNKLWQSEKHFCLYRNKFYYLLNLLAILLGVMQLKYSTTESGTDGDWIFFVLGTNWNLLESPINFRSGLIIRCAHLE